MEREELILKEKKQYESYSEDEKIRWIRSMERLYIYDSSLKPGEIYPGITIGDIVL